MECDASVFAPIVHVAPTAAPSPLFYVPSRHAWHVASEDARPAGAVLYTVAVPHARYVAPPTPPPSARPLRYTPPPLPRRVSVKAPLVTSPSVKVVRAVTPPRQLRVPPTAPPPLPLRTPDKGAVACCGILDVCGRLIFEGM